MNLKPELKNRIEDFLKSDRVVLFMKGTREAPQCGFSATVVEILDEFLPTYKTVNVLEDPELREGIKAFAAWPTIPQLYVEEKFVGGCDVLRQLYQSGEIYETLRIKRPEISTPEITITSAAAAAFRRAMDKASANEYLRIHISADFACDLSFGPQEGNDIQIQHNDITLLMSPLTASRANGLTIDFQRNSMGEGFEFDNPNAPPPVKQLSPHDLELRRNQGENFWLLDVRTKKEWDQARIPGAKLLLDLPQQTLDSASRDDAIIFYCGSGGRSQRMAEKFRFRGFNNIYNLAGGIKAWSTEIDPSLKNALP